ncbi:hypothetical protein ASPWEDRAFT_172832 [Aspergillus wentii DTO 134E9]|uniref:T6SS Phospholipase effector Tle1-like catalytic domain-containing protein n=1 Tax=Aspergillus wentii DTO 134E9 TaxID=1073089 RepID=A0A1L9RMC2_ASPWE|nr:uncharacterized protein ASPWEDRAFT_172832 [Aspergillus wentii DTO 134E9]OJJ36044.1 hypothetical protein ASPWEDRAFT_172832 [Aspergillus wentii DTO 134E9]
MTQRHHRQIVLCFDGTGKTFRADGSESNILKIFGMLNRTDDEHYCYYQPGIGTDITPTSLASTAIRKKKPWNNKALELALGQSFDGHLLGGYRFLMRHYRSGAKIYIFGFSRGAYTARFLNEMLDWVGLLSADNEEMIPFIWEAFVAWKSSEEKQRQNADYFLKACAENICRRVERVQFLGLFDTVNSIAEFKLNSETIPSSRVIRHAVSIDERRVKFRPVLLNQTRVVPRHRKKHHHEKNIPMILLHRDEKHEEKPEKHIKNKIYAEDVVSQNPSSSDSISSPDAPLPRIDGNDQDIEEVWFPGGHTDIGGGWKLRPGEEWPLSHTPLVWMVQEAQRAGLHFDEAKLKRFRCIEDGTTYPKVVGDEALGDIKSWSSPFLDALYASTIGYHHDLLQRGHEISLSSVVAWKAMECFPVKRMELQSDASWKLTRWPPSLGGMRDIPPDAQVHITAIRRMMDFTDYKPCNLFAGSGRRYGKDIISSDEKGAWRLYKHQGDPVRQTFIRNW